MLRKQDFALISKITNAVVEHFTRRMSTEKLQTMPSSDYTQYTLAHYVPRVLRYYSSKRKTPGRSEKAVCRSSANSS